MPAGFTFKAICIGRNHVLPQAIVPAAVAAGDLYEGGLSARRLRRSWIQGYELPAGFTFCGSDTGRQPGFVDAVIFLAVWTGDFHSDKRLSGFRFQWFRVQKSRAIFFM